MKSIRLRFWKVMTMTLLSVLFPLTLSQKGLALNCKSEQVKFFIEKQLKINLNQGKPINQVQNAQLRKLANGGIFYIRN